MSLPKGVIDFLNESAQSNGAEQPRAGDNLFKMGVLDSFALVDFVTVLEQECGIRIPDSDVNPTNFETIEAVESYVQAHKG